MKIVAVAKGKIVVAEVDLGSKEKILNSNEFGWTPETLDLVFSEIVKRFKTKKFRILVADELSYIVRLEIPENLSREKEREYVADQLKEKIPESLGGNEWDYKKVSETSAIVFALVGDFFKVLTNAIQNASLEVEAIEPEAVAKSRDANPLVGIALKEDIKGEDAKILNIDLQEGKEVNSDSDETHESESDKGEEKIQPLKSKIRISTIILFVLFIAGLIVLAKMFLFKNPKESAKIPSGVTLTPILTPTETPEPTGEEKIDVSEYKIEVQNGSGLLGEADVVSNILSSEGFKNIETGNADSYIYQKTEVRLKKDIPGIVFETVNKALNSDYEVILSDEKLEDNSAFDAIIIVGKRIE